MAASNWSAFAFTNSKTSSDKSALDVQKKDCVWSITARPLRRISGCSIRLSEKISCLLGRLVACLQPSNQIIIINHSNCDFMWFSHQFLKIDPAPLQSWSYCWSPLLVLVVVQDLEPAVGGPMTGHWFKDISTWMCPEIGYTMIYIYMIYCCTMIYPRIAIIYIYTVIDGENDLNWILEVSWNPPFSGQSQIIHVTGRKIWAPLSSIIISKSILIYPLVN